VFTCYRHAKNIKRKKQVKRDKKEKIVIGGTQEKGNWGSYSILVKRGLVGSSNVFPLGGLVIYLFSRFGRHNGAYESNYFLEQRRRIVMTMILISTNNKTMKMKRLREGGFVCVCVCVCVLRFCFVMGPFFLTFLSSPKSFLLPKIWLLPTN